MLTRAMFAIASGLTAISLIMGGTPSVAADSVSLNMDKTKSVASMEKVRQILTKYNVKLFINHDKAQIDKLKLLPVFYD